MSRKNVLRVVIGVVIGGGLLAVMLTYQVRFTEAAVLETFGEPGEKPVPPGLHFRVPLIQNVVTYDKRLQHFESIYEEGKTLDDLNILVSVYVCWRLDDPIHFRRAVGVTLREGEEKVRSLVRDATLEVVGTRRMAEFASSTEPVQLVQMETDILSKVQAAAREQLGVVIRRVGIKRMSLPAAVSEAAMENIKTDRSKRAKNIIEEGEARAKAILARADSVAEQILSFADRYAEAIKDRGRKEVAVYYQSYKGITQGKDHQAFAIFLRRMEFLAETLKRKGFFVLDGSAFDASFGFFRDPPRRPEDLGRGAITAAPASRPAGAAPRRGAAGGE